MNASPATMTLRELADAVRDGLLTLEDVRQECDERKRWGLDIDQPREQREEE